MHPFRYCFLLLFIALNTFSQKKISVEDIFSGTFRTEQMYDLQTLKKTNQYTVLNYDQNTRSISIDVYDFATLEKVKTLINTNNFKELEGIDGYTFNTDETQMLIATNSESIYRYSAVAEYFLFDIASSTLSKILDFKIQEPTFSPDGKKIAYVKDNNLYVYDLASKEITTITTDGKKNEIINGITDWVYEEEFTLVRAFDWSKDSKKIAYIRFDERKVPEFSMSIFEKQLYPNIQTFKYPKAGEKNSDVSLRIYELSNKRIVKVDLKAYSDFYIPRIEWTNDENTLSAQILNRHQNKLDLLFIDGKSGKYKIALSETDKAYVDITDNLTFLKDNSFIWTSEKDGFNHIYHYAKNGELKTQITKGNWDVTAFYGVDENTNTVYFQSVENGVINRDIFKIDILGKVKTKLSTQIGTNNATFSTNLEFYINTYSSATNPPVFTLNVAKDGKIVKEIKNNEALNQKLKEYNLPTKEFITIKTEKGIELNAWIIKPANAKDKKLPVFMTQYSGPGSQSVTNVWHSSNDYWYYMLSQQGFAVVCVDGRGTGNRGAEFKKITQNDLGKLEVEDQIDAAKVLGAMPDIDKTRLGIFGWSYGGFMAANCILQGSDVFKMAIAVAPVTNWRFYDSVYTERYLKTPQENPGGYDRNSPINHANKLKGKFLIIHGSADDNVHVQNTMEMMEALIQANKQFESQIYPDKNHGIYGGRTRLQLYTKMTNFINANL